MATLTERLAAVTGAPATEVTPATNCTYLTPAEAAQVLHRKPCHLTEARAS